MKTVTLANYRPSRRADGQFWARAKVEGADQPDASLWEVVDEVSLDPLSTESSDAPGLRSFTVQTDKAWLRLTFLDADDGEDAAALISVSQPSFRPTGQEVADILQARTYSAARVD